MKTIRVMLVDDHPIVRAGIRTLLEEAPDICIVGESNNGAEVLSMVNALAPDILLLDMEMPGLSGVEVARQLNEHNSPVRVLALSAHDDQQYITSLLASGAAGYLIKEEAATKILEAVRGVAQGKEGWLSRQVAAQMTDWVQTDRSDPPHPLSEREHEVLLLIVAGKTNQEIGRELGISEKTVEKHVGSIFVKLNVSSRVEAAVYAVQNGLAEG